MNMPTNARDFNDLVTADLRTTSRIIAQCFEKRHDNVLRDIRSLIDANPDWGVLNFEYTPYVDPQNGQTYQMYEMTRDGYSMLVMGFTGRKALDWKIRFLEAFNAMEAKLRAPAIPDLSDPAVLLQLLTDHASKRLEAEQRAAEAQAKAVAAEDVQALARIAKADGSLSITEAAKGLQMRPTDLFNWLSRNAWIYKRPGGSTWLGFALRCNQGLLEHKSVTVTRADGSEKVTEQVRITPKGLTVLAKALNRPADLLEGGAA